VERNIVDRLIIFILFFLFFLGLLALGQMGEKVNVGDYVEFSIAPA
jgi:hypothetical protein